MKDKGSILNSLISLFHYYRDLGLKTIDQMPEDSLTWQYNNESNSVAIIVKHLHGNMMSRWTDFLTSDGEKDWRQRDGEFEASLNSRDEIYSRYHQGWDCVFDALNPLTDADLDRIVYIRNQGHTVLEAVHRQLAHYSYHIGQIVYVGKLVRGDEWKTLSIARNASKSYNADKFSKDKSRRHFTEDL